MIVLFILAAKKMFQKQKIIAREGMRVHVFSLGEKDDLGFGTIIKIDDSDNYPSEIKLDSGKTTEGVECCWFPLEES